MAAITGTVTAVGKNGEKGMLYFARGVFTFSAALVTTDTYNISNLLPRGGARIVAGRIVGSKMDTNATPQLAFRIGNSDDDDGYLTQQTQGTGTQTGFSFDGALVNQVVTNRNLSMTVNTNPATGATSGTFNIELLLEAV